MYVEKSLGPVKLFCIEDLKIVVNATIRHNLSGIDLSILLTTLSLAKTFRIFCEIGLKNQQEKASFPIAAVSVMQQCVAVGLSNVCANVQ